MQNGDEDSQAIVKMLKTLETHGIDFIKWHAYVFILTMLCNMLTKLCQSTLWPV